MKKYKIKEHIVTLEHFLEGDRRGGWPIRMSEDEAREFLLEFGLPFGYKDGLLFKGDLGDIDKDLMIQYYNFKMDEYRSMYDNLRTKLLDLTGSIE